MSSMKILKYGSILTAGGIAGAYFAGRSGADLGQGDIAGASAAKGALLVGGGLTAAAISRKPIGRAMSYVGNKMAGPKIPGQTSKIGLVFRKIRGRVVPIRTK